MRTKIGTTGALAIMVITLTGCTQLTVKPVDPHHPELTQGVRYALPRPFLQVTPMSDGTTDVQFLYLPDPDNTYAVQADSYLAANTVGVTVDDAGIVQSVSLSPDNTAVSSAAVTSGGDILTQLAQSLVKQQATSQPAKKVLRDGEEKVHPADDAATPKPAGVPMLYAIREDGQHVTLVPVVSNTAGAARR